MNPKALARLALADHARRRQQQRIRQKGADTQPWKVLTPPQLEVAKLACNLALDHMEANGNEIGQAQATTILALTKLYCEMLFGHLKGRYAAGVPTGYGKTTSAAALIVALHKMGVTDRPLAVAASRVEALCDLRSDIDVIAQRAGCLDGLADKVGMVHSYGGVPHPPTADNDNRQFLLVTQAQLSGGGSKPETVLAHNCGNPRLVVWDEALLPSTVYSLDLKEAHSGAAAVLSDSFFSTASAEAAAWFKDVQERLMSAQSTDEAEGAVVGLPYLDGDKHLRLKATLKDHRYSDVLLPLMEMAGGEVRVNPRRNDEGGRGAVVTYRVSVPDCLDRIVILDASFALNRLYEVDQRVRPWSESPSVRSFATELDLGRLKDYSQVTVRYMQRGGGRSSVEADVLKGGAKLVSDVVQVISDIPADEAVLVFAFKPRGGRTADLPAALRAGLQRAEVDLNAAVTVGNGSDAQVRPRINIATWGQECGTNQYSHCRHVVLMGVLRLSFGEILGRYLAASDDLGSPFPKTTEEVVMLGHLGHAVYQAASRGASRSTDSYGRAGAMTLWLVESNPRIREEIEKVMPGVRWADWRGEYSRAKVDPKDRASPKTDKAFAATVEFLEGLPAEVNEVSTARALAVIRQRIAVTASVWRDVRARLVDSPVRGWLAPAGSRSIVRAASLPACEAEAAADLFTVEEV